MGLFILDIFKRIDLTDGSCVFLGTIFTKSPDTAVLLGLVKRQSLFSPVSELKEQADFQ